MSAPRVTVICLCYNQERFVREAIRSVINQRYSDIQLVVVDDASSDKSVAVISECVARHPRVEFISLKQNVGNCKAFNRGLLQAQGDYIIDLAADDILLPDRIGKGVMELQRQGALYGVNFSDAEWIAENGSHIRFHSDRYPHHSIPQGDIYRQLIERFFICSPTMMFSRKVIETLGGYDESLGYEDFDFWIRSSRDFHYCYTPEVLVKKRVVRNSMSFRQFSLMSPQLRSTFRVCEKIMHLNRRASEQEALGKRILYETGVCLRLLHLPLVLKYSGLQAKNRRLRY